MRAGGGRSLTHAGPMPMFACAAGSGHRYATSHAFPSRTSSPAGAGKHGNMGKRQGRGTSDATRHILCNGGAQRRPRAQEHRCGAVHFTPGRNEMPLKPDPETWGRPRPEEGWRSPQGAERGRLAGKRTQDTRGEHRVRLRYALRLRDMHLDAINSWRVAD